MKTDFKKLKVGSKLSETQYYSVVKIAGDKVQLVNGIEQNVVVDKKYVEECLISADQFDTEEKITKTDLTAKFLQSPNVVFTVSFNKQVKEVDVVKEIMDTYSDSTPKTMETAVKKAVKKALAGEERVLTGYHIGVQDEFGRISAIDMNIEKDRTKEYDTRLRLVDPRQLNFLILKGVKYIVK
jgi:endo-alpha-1,4-polygalactosaminidase (GH114 family)